MSDKRLDGKVAMITGASKGLGKAMGLALGAAGASLVLVSRNLEQLNEVARAVKDTGGEALVFQTDVSEEDQVLKLERDVVDKFGRAHILINNAGINIRKPLVEFKLEEWHRVLNTNLTSVFLMCRSFVPHMKGTGYGRIINMTSTMSWVSMPGRAAYSASKTALLGVTRALALELAPEGITVNGISPGPFATEMNMALTQNPETK
jgi:NAD(P)-dependent dehydrogenase (short-subunit alcohol dehydrogenase family)